MDNPSEIEQMLKLLGPNWVGSSEGYALRRTGRTSLLYSEGGKELSVEVEPGDGLAIYVQTVVSWRPPHQDEPLRSTDRQRIVARILEALRHMGIEAILA